MDIVRLAGVGLAAMAVSGAAWGQMVNPAMLRPGPEETLKAVADAGCERSETAAFVRFYCAEGEAFWYFTHEGRPEHPGYQVMSAHDSMPSGFDRFVIGPPPTKPAAQSTFGFGRGGMGANVEAYGAWTKAVYAAWQTDAANLRRPQKRGRGKLYPLEPQ